MSLSTLCCAHGDKHPLQCGLPSDPIHHPSPVVVLCVESSTASIHPTQCNANQSINQAKSCAKVPPEQPQNPIDCRVSSPSPGSPTATAPSCPTSNADKKCLHISGVALLSTRSHPRWLMENPGESSAWRPFNQGQQGAHTPCGTFFLPNKPEQKQMHLAARQIMVAVGSKTEHAPN